MKSWSFYLKNTAAVAALMALIFTLSSCGGDDDSKENPQPNLENTTWLAAGDNCNSYFQFKDGEYLSLNPCYNDQDAIELVAYIKGTYTLTGNTLKLVATETCNSEAIGEISNFTITMNGNTLKITAGGMSQDFTKIQALPEIPANAEFGYWDFENDDAWVPVSSCSLEN